ncbi:MAG: T9SS type A sorting domain-containing protein [Bacteroidetes bacterium]|nr:T9SS type A sorting domain-containing protein [Bacteroidota bacterium]
MKNLLYCKSFRIPSKVFPFLILLFVTVSTLQLSCAYGQPLNGNYTIDATLASGGTNFQSFNAFAGSINLNGVSGPVIVTVVPGTGPYIEQVIFNTIAGTGPNATVTLEGSGEQITAVTTTTNRHVIRLTNCQYFTINNLHISRDPTSTGGFYGIHIYNTGSHITISNCTVDITGTNSTLYGAYIASGSETSILETGDFHYITMTGNTSDGGGYGASVFGLVSNLASHIMITNNTFLNCHSNGVYLRETDSAVIAGNLFDKSTTVVTSCNAIQMAQNANVNARIYNNTITVSQVSNGTQTQRGIYLFNGTGHKVYNNVIQNIQLTAGNYTAIEVRSSATAPEIYFNTISIDNPLTTTGTLYGIREELSNTNSVLRNNMISISQPSSGTKSGLVLGSTSVITSAFNSNYNDLWVPGGNAAQKGTLTNIIYYPTLANWQTASGQDANSLSADPFFASALHPQPTNGLVDNTGIPVSWILTDFVGAVRGNPPDPGAYEFSSAPPAEPDTIFGALQACENSGNTYYILPVTGATYYTWTVTGALLISGQGTLSITVGFANTPCTISVVAVNSTGSSNPVSINIGINPAPQVNFILSQDSVCVNWAPFTLSGGSPLNGTYSGSGVLNNIFSPAAAGAGNHLIIYSYEAVNGCSAFATDTLFVDVCTGINGILSEKQTLTIFPNPCSSQLTVTLPDRSSCSRVTLYDQLGNIVKSFDIDSQVIILSCSGLPAGLYLMEVTTATGMRYTTKVAIFYAM